ncbi:MAG: MarR family winged helix-turn-helix transcriptional regulator [Minisyncoccota bacterium]
MVRRIAEKQAHSSDDVARAVSLFFAVRRIIRTELAKGKKLDPSTWLHIETMKFIADHDEPKMKDLAAYLSITAPSTTSLVRGLVESGLVAYFPDQHDRRASRLGLTTKGRAELKKAVARGITLLGGLFSTLSETELSAFTNVLERIKKEAAG